MITGADIRNLDEYHEILIWLEKDKKISEFYSVIKDLEINNPPEYLKRYTECIEYQKKMIPLIKRIIKIKKIKENIK